MSLLLRTALAGALPALRHEPTAKRIRAVLGGRTVVDSIRAAQVWEPRRVVGVWAVPETDVDAELTPIGEAGPDDGTYGYLLPDVSDRPVLDPSVPFQVHTAAGTAVDLTIGGTTLPARGFRPADPDLAGYVLLDFDAFDEWWEEDVRNVGHPRDPFHRIDVLPSSRTVRVELDGEVLAESNRPTMLFETMLPARIYLPREDVRAELTATPTRTTCAYKGFASYYAVSVHGDPVPDLAWTYESPLPEAEAVSGLIAFFDERVDVILDGAPLDRPVTPWSRRQ
jgi:uncharacterized protein (DUF427 family)